MISYEQKEKKFNFRVGGILESPDRKKVLIHRLSNFNFWLLPGGRVEMLEDTENAILREIQEELGVTSEIDRLVSITESFFDMKDKTYHELGFNYLLRLPENSQLLKMQGEFAGFEGEKYRYKWIDKELLSQITFKPNYMIPILQNIPQEIVHIIKDERVRKKKILKDNVYKREELIYVFFSLVKKLFERNKYGRSNNKIFRYCNY